MIDISSPLSLNFLNFLMVQFFFLKHEGIKRTLSFLNRMIDIPSLLSLNSLNFLMV